MEGKIVSQPFCGNGTGVPHSAEEMDNIRQRNIAYEYLCHLEEAKKWMEAVLKEDLPPTTELEENLRNGVYLARIGHIVAPEATFHPETTDVYDKKNMPRVIYCLHALSTHLYKLGKAPLIQDLYGKVNFTAIIAINEAIDRMDSSSTLEALRNPAARLQNVFSTCSIMYQEVLQEAKQNKIEDALNRSLKNSYVADVYDQLLTQSEIQEHVSSVNKRISVAVVNTALDNGTWQDLYSALRNPALKLPVDINKQTAPLYYEEMKIDKQECGKNLTYDEIVSSIRVLSYIAAVTLAVDKNNFEETWKALSSPNAHFSKNLSYDEIVSSVRVLSYIAAVTHAVDKNNLEETWKALSSPNAHFSDLNVALKEKYWETLTALRQNKLANACECPALTYTDIQDCVDIVNEKFEENESNKVILALHQLNSSLQERNVPAFVKVLKSQELNVIDEISASDVVSCWRKKQKDGSELWLEDVQLSLKKVLEDIQDAKSACEFLIKMNKTMGCDSKPLTTIFKEIDVNMNENSHVLKLFSAVKDWKFQKGAGSTSPWIIHNIRSGREVYLNVERCTYSWKRPDDFIAKSHVEAHTHIENNKIDNWLIPLQARCKGFLLRKKIGDRLEFLLANTEAIIKIQAWWRCVIQQRKFKNMLNDYQFQYQHKGKGSEGSLNHYGHHNLKAQEVVKHGKNLNEMTKHHQQASAGPEDTNTNRGLKSLTKDGRKMLDGYQHLFYALQTSPSYLAKLIFCLPLSRTTRFVQTVILTLFNYGSNPREEYLLLKLFKTALEEEVRCKFTKPSDAVTGNPLVLKMVVNYSRQLSKQNALRDIVGPLILQVLEDKKVTFETNPVDIFKSWRNQFEMETGNTSNLPYSVTQVEALAFEEIQKKLNSGIKRLQAATLAFLKRIVECRHLIPYGMLYIAKVVGNLIYYNYINSAIVAPDAFDIISLPPDRTLSNNQRRNLASIAKILQFAASKKGFGEESKHLMCLNPFIIECHETLKCFFRECCEVEELEEHFSMHEYTEATLISRPAIYISLQEICDTHELLLKYQDNIAPDPSDSLHELLEDLAGKDASLPITEVCLTLVNKFEVPENDDQDNNKLFIRTKELLVSILPCLQGGNTLAEALVVHSPVQEELYQHLVQRKNIHSDVS
ncbi:Ras GTPase-activating-like protein IQGAP2 [Blattella germanica]|nr:Ras GTPase-activating-like protein IQGAP2 [Blattella germanica]